jgi:hypothetical protein
MSNYLLFLLLLACPLAMWFMMRGSHGDGGHAHSHGSGPASIDELRRQRKDLDHEIATRERR